MNGNDPSRHRDRFAPALRILTMLLAMSACTVLAIAPEFHEGTHARASIERLHDPIAWMALALIAVRISSSIVVLRQADTPAPRLPLLWQAVNVVLLAELLMWNGGAPTGADHSPIATSMIWLSIALQAMLPLRRDR